MGKKGKAATSAIAKETIPAKEAEVVDSEAVASDAEVVSEDEPVLAEVTPRNAAKKKNRRKMGKEKTGLTFNPYQTRQLMKKGKYAKYIRPGAAIYMAAVLEYLVAEITEIAGNCARDNKKKRVIPRHIALAIKMDEECNQLLKGVIMPQGGVLPFIHKCLVKKVDSDTFRGWSRQNLSVNKSGSA